MFTSELMEVLAEPPTMSSSNENGPPLMQRLYDRIWLIALTALLFWLLTYVLWGLLDVLSVPGGA